MVESSSEGRGIGGEYGRKDVLFSSSLSRPEQHVHFIRGSTGITVISETSGAVHVDNNEPDNPIYLTNLQLDRLRLLARGYKNEDIAIKLSVAEKTIKNSLTAIFRALRTDDRTHAVIKGLQFGFLSMSDLGRIGVDAIPPEASISPLPVDSPLSQ